MRCVLVGEERDGEIMQLQRGGVASGMSRGNICFFVLLKRYVPESRLVATDDMV
jgi:hypothetical protein